MDATKFDSLAKSLAEKQNRRQVLKGLVGISGAAVAGLVVKNGADAARRGFAGPLKPTPAPPAPCVPDCGEDVCEVSDGCGGTCLCQGSDTCVDNECKAECEILGLCLP